MFNFFRRKKSQDDGDKREKPKIKEKSGSPFFRRKEPKKAEGCAEATVAVSEGQRAKSPISFENGIDNASEEFLTNDKQVGTPMGQETYPEMKETISDGSEGYRTPDEITLRSSDIVTTVELNCSGKNPENKFTLPSVFLNPTVDMTVIVKRRTPEPESGSEIWADNSRVCHATVANSVETDRDGSDSGTLPVADDEPAISAMGTSSSSAEISDDNRKIGDEGRQTGTAPAGDASFREVPEYLGTVDNGRGKSVADIFEGAPVADGGAVVSGESNRGETTPDDSENLLVLPSDQYQSDGEGVLPEDNVSEEMTYEIEERGKTDASRDSEEVSDDCGLNLFCDSHQESDLKIRTEGNPADFFPADQTQYDSGDVDGIDNTEIDGADIAANNENNSAVVFENPSEPSECNHVNSRTDLDEIPEGEEDENACAIADGSPIEIEKMSEVVSELVETEVSEKIVKRVRWADIEGGTDLCCADSGASGEGSSEEDEDEDEDNNDEISTERADSPSEDDSSGSEDESDTEESKTGSSEKSGSEIKLEEITCINKTEEISSSDDSDDSSEENDSQAENQINLKEVSAQENGETIVEMSHRDDNSKHLCNQISELQHKLMNKTAGMERLQSELESVYNESELARKRYRRLQDELDACKRCNIDLIERLNKQPGEIASNFGMAEEVQLKEAEERIIEVERKLSSAREENLHLLNSLKKLEKDRDQEMQAVQQTLDDALEEQHRMEIKFGKEFEQLRTLNTNRELKLIDDFEWKLREVEKTCKKQIQEKEKLNEQKILELRTKLSSAEAALEKVSHLKNCEMELKHLRNITHDQKKSLRTLTRQLEELQVNEKVLQEEANRLRTALEQEKANFSAIQSLHKEDLAEKDRRLHFRLDMQKNHLNAEWEDKLRRECSRIKIELERTFRDEKRQAIEAAKLMKEQENVQNKQIWENRIQELVKEVENIKRKLAQKDENHKRALENAQSKYDSDILELRRKMDKLDMSYLEKIEKMQETHEQTLAKITEDCERKIQQCESNLQAQAGTTRTTLELVKQQMLKEADIRIQEMRDKHDREMEEQWHRLMDEKERELKQAEEQHKETVEQLHNEIAALRKKSGFREEPQAKSSNSGLGKSFMGLFEKKDPSQKHKNDPVAEEIVHENKPERDGLHKEERKENKVPQKHIAEQPNCTQDCQQKKQGEDKKEAAQTSQKEGTNKSHPSQRHHRRSRKSKSGKR